MLFLSREKSPSYLYLSGGVNFIETLQGMQRKTTQPKWLKFEALNAPIFAPGLPGKGVHPNEAWGQLYSERAAKGIKEQQNAVEEFLLEHEDYGIEFIAVQEQSGSEQDFADDQMIVSQGDKGAFYCKLCEKSLGSAQAVNGHKTANKHIEMRENYILHLKQGRQHIVIK